MGSLGGYLIVFGGLSAVLSFFNYEFILLSWIDTWGDGIAWFIRAGIILIGGLLFNAEQRREQQARQAQQGQVS